jgi:hypothetical protein
LSHAKTAETGCTWDTTPCDRPGNRRNQDLPEAKGPGRFPGSFRGTLRSDLQISLAKISRKEGIEQQKRRGGNQRRPVARARKTFGKLAVKRRIYSGAVVARFLGVTALLVNGDANSEGLGNLD